MEPVTVFYISFASISLFTCILQLLLSFRKKGNILVLVSSMLSFVIFIRFNLNFLCSAPFSNDIHHLTLLRSELIMTQVIMICMIGVTFHFFKNLSKFNVLVQIMAIASLMVISIILPDRVLFGANSADHFSNVAESFNIKLVSKGFTLWRAFFDLNILLFVFAIISIVLKRGNSFGSKAIFILYTGAGLLLLSALSDQLVDLGYIDTIYLLPFAIFLFYLILNIIPYLFLLNDVFENHLVNEKERTWRNLVNEAKVIVIGLNRMGLVEFMNPYFIDITGYEKDEVLGKDWFELFLPKERYNEVQGAFIEGLEFEFHAYYVNPILKKNNEELVIKWYNVRNRDENGTITGSYSIGIDITEESLEKEESARKLNEAEELIEKLKREIPGA